MNYYKQLTQEQKQDVARCVFKTQASIYVSRQHEELTCDEEKNKDELNHCSKIYLDVVAARKQNYQDYLQSDEWKLTAQLVKKRDENKCRSCGATKRLHVHHLTYKRIYSEPLYDLITLCEECHGLVHRMMKVY